MTPINQSGRFTNHAATAPRIRIADSVRTKAAEADILEGAGVPLVARRLLQRFTHELRVQDRRPAIGIIACRLSDLLEQREREPAGA